jgi:hypothetical protein
VARYKIGKTGIAARSGLQTREWHVIADPNDHGGS